MIIAGPPGKNEKGYRGFYIFDSASVEETMELLKSDPAIKSNLLDTDLYNWYGSAALPTYLGVHRKIEKGVP